MERKDQLSKNQQIFSLLSVLGSAIVCAGLAVLGILYFYNPSGQYLVHNALLSPELLSKETISSMNKRGGVEFGSIEFSYLDSAQNKMKTISVDQSNYALFYDLIRSEKSIEKEEVAMVAFSSQPATLVIRFQLMHASKGEGEKVVQELQIAPEGNYFRIALHEQSASPRWVYYYFPNIYQLALNTLTK